MIRFGTYGSFWDALDLAMESSPVYTTFDELPMVKRRAGKSWPTSRKNPILSYMQSVWHLDV